MQKTYTTTIEKPRLVIRYDNDLESPRTAHSNLGYFITKERNKYSPDKSGIAETLYNLMVTAGECATDTDSHMAEIKRLWADTAFTEKIIAIYPVYKYEHGNVLYRRGTATGFDYSNCGFYIVTDQSIKEIDPNPSDIPKIIDQELEDYTKWVNGEIYAFTLYDTAGNIEDSCGGFYDLEDIKDYLPKEWKNERLYDYLTTN